MDRRPKSSTTKANVRFETASDRPDLVARVFKAKLDALMEDLKKNMVLGRVNGWTYVVETDARRKVERLEDQSAAYAHLPSNQLTQAQSFILAKGTKAEYDLEDAEARFRHANSHSIDRSSRDTAAIQVVGCPLFCGSYRERPKGYRGELHSVQSRQRRQRCRPGNAAQACSTDPCGYRHVCSGCNGLGHTALGCTQPRQGGGPYLGGRSSGASGSGQGAGGFGRGGDTYPKNGGDTPTGPTNERETNGFA